MMAVGGEKNAPTVESYVEEHAKLGTRPNRVGQACGQWSWVSA